MKLRIKAVKEKQKFLTGYDYKNSNVDTKTCRDFEKATEWLAEIMEEVADELGEDHSDYEDLKDNAEMLPENEGPDYTSKTGDYTFWIKNAIRKAHAGKKHTPEHNLKVSKALTGRPTKPKSEEGRRKISEAHKARRWFYNPLNDRCGRFPIGQEPEGWLRGRGSFL